MAYETTLFVTASYGHGENNHIASVDVSATGDMGYAVTRLLTACRDDETKRRAVYMPTRNKLVAIDDNGAHITAVPIDQLVDAMRKQNRKDKYRRFDLALAMLDQFTGDNASKWEDLDIEIVQFGH